MRYFALVFVAGSLALAGCGSSQSSSPTPTATTALNHVHSIAILPHNANVLYLGAHYRLYKSTDGGHTWHPLTRQMMLSMALDSAHPPTIYAVSSQNGLVKSTDAGAHWKNLSGIKKGQVTGVAMDPAIGVVLAYGAGVYRSVDGGAHWSKALGGQSVENAAFGGNRAAYLATGNGLYVSHDDGAHWKTVSAIGNQPVIQVAAAAATAYAATAIALFRTVDGGRHWKSLSGAPAGIDFLGIAPSDTKEVFADVSGTGFMVSRNGGVTWHSANAGIRDRNFNASTIRVAPSSPNVAYTGSWGLHFYATRDGGRHWTRTATLVH